MDQHTRLKFELINTTKYMFKNGLAWGNSGNISVRTAENKFLITKSGTYLGDLKENDFIEWETLREIDKRLADRPSKEVPMHQAIYEERPEINAVLHASPLYSTMIACSDIPIPANSFVEGMYYLEKVKRIPYAHPGSVELGELVRKEAKKTNIILLKNHGVLVYDTSLEEARMALHTLEFACKMAVIMKKTTSEIEEIPDNIVIDFLQNAGYKPKRKWDI